MGYHIMAAVNHTCMVTVASPTHQRMSQLHQEVATQMQQMQPLLNKY
jgi:hypothetical protein